MRARKLERRALVVIERGRHWATASCRPRKTIRSADRSSGKGSASPRASSWGEHTHRSDPRGKRGQLSFSPGDGERSPFTVPVSLTGAAVRYPSPFTIRLPLSPCLARSFVSHDVGWTAAQLAHMTVGIGLRLFPHVEPPKRWQRWSVERTAIDGGAFLPRPRPPMSLVPPEGLYS